MTELESGQEVYNGEIEKQKGGAKMSIEIIHSEELRDKDKK